MKRQKYVDRILMQQHGTALTGITLVSIDSSGYLYYKINGDTVKAILDPSTADGISGRTNVTDTLTLSGSTTISIGTGKTYDINILNERNVDVTSGVTFSYSGNKITSIGASGLITAGSVTGSTTVTARHSEGATTTFTVNTTL